MDNGRGEGRAIIKLINRGKYSTPVLEEFEHLTQRLSSFLTQIFDENGNLIEDSPLEPPPPPAWTDIVFTPGYVAVTLPMTITVTNARTFGYWIDGDQMHFTVWLEYTLGGTANTVIYIKLPVPYKAMRSLQAVGRITTPGTAPGNQAAIINLMAGDDFLSVTRMDSAVMGLGANQLSAQLTIPVYQVTP